MFRADAEILSEAPAAIGGDPLGTWEADRVALQAYAPPDLLSAISGLSFSGRVSGRVTLSPDGSYEAGYILSVSLSFSLFGIPIQTDYEDTARSEGIYRLEEPLLILENIPTPGVRDTFSYSAEEDTLRLIQTVPLGEFEDLVSDLVAETGPPLGILRMTRKEGEADGPITADFDNSGKVDFIDFLGFVLRFGTQSGEIDYDETFDLNHNDEVDFLDFLDFARQFGRVA